VPNLQDPRLAVEDLEPHVDADRLRRVCPPEEQTPKDETTAAKPKDDAVA
jgi:hypothetical protein